MQVAKGQGPALCFQRRLSPPLKFSHMKFIARWLFVSLLAVPAVGAPANDAAVAAPLLWMRDRSLTASANALLADMRDAEKYGLRSRDYAAGTLAQRAASLTPEAGDDTRAAVDRDISDAVARSLMRSSTKSTSAASLNMSVKLAKPSIVAGRRRFSSRSCKPQGLAARR